MKKTILFLILILASTSIISCSSDDKKNNHEEDNYNNRSLIKSITTISYSQFAPNNILKYKFSLSYDASGNLQSIVREPISSNNSIIEYENYSWSQDSINIQYHTSETNMQGIENYLRYPNGYVKSGEFTFQYSYNRTQHYECVYNQNNRLTK